MRILANENCPRVVVESLRTEGHDVSWVWEDGRGSSDSSILDRAQREDRLLVTFDKDFGDLAFRSRQPASTGVILFRISGPPGDQAELICLALRGPAEWRGRFSTVTNERVRTRPLPPV